MTSSETIARTVIDGINATASVIRVRGARV
jgi:hypothetical protein